MQKIISDLIVFFELRYLIHSPLFIQNFDIITQNIKRHFNVPVVSKKNTILFSNSKTIESIQLHEIAMLGTGFSSARWSALFHPNETF